MDPLVPLSSPDITDAEIAAVTAVLRTPHLCMGPELNAFESALAEYHSVPHAIAVSSGTAGLHIALLTLGVGEGDEVVVPSFAFIAVANAVIQVGATPVFADIDPATLNLTPGAIEGAISPRTRAIIVVHAFGIPADMLGIRALAERHNLKVIEDACEAIGAQIGERRAGSFGDLAVFGFYPNKQITTGEGGAVLAQSQAHADRLRKLRNQGRGPQGDAVGSETVKPGSPDRTRGPELGFNYRLSDIACALGRVQLERIEEILDLRRRAAERYDALLGGLEGVELPPLHLPGISISWFVYVVRLAKSLNRERIQQFLTRRGIASSGYFEPIHEQRGWVSSKLGPAALPVTEQMGLRTLALPFFTRIEPSQQEKVTEALRDALEVELQ